MADLERNLHMRLITASLILLLLSAAHHAEELRGKVVHIADGDTITVLDAAKTQHKMRLEGIDTPEHDQAFGTNSKDRIAGKEVIVRRKSKDRYGRILGDI